MALLSVLSLGAALAVPKLSAATDANSNWLTTQTISVEKVGEQPASTVPFSTGLDCEPTDFRVGPNNDGQQLHGCAYQTPFGTVANNYVIAGAHGTLPLNVHNKASGYILASPPGDTAHIIGEYIPSSWSSGSVLRKSNYDPTLFSYVTLYGVPMIYEYQYSPSNPQNLTDARGVVPVNTQTMAYSQNGQWLVVTRTDGGIERINVASWQTKLIGWNFSMRFSETGADNFAISNDGRYIALNMNVGTTTAPKPELRVYDTDTCQDLSASAPNQNHVLPSSVVQCEYNDIWNGKYRSATYPGIISKLPGAEYPRHLRFVEDNTLAFDAVYSRSSSSDFSVGSYEVNSSGYSAPTLRLLGMGDSYISGEGAFSYRDGTDTSNNICHNSTLAYPQLIGAKLYSRYQSVACSGAKMYDVDASINTPYGFADSTEKYRGQVNEKKPWDERADGLGILMGFTPGFGNQKLFSDKYSPKNVLLSIGGNDIHFADILTSCVAPYNIETCYPSKESRIELMQNIIDRYDDLVKTYETVAVSSGGKVYAVGYPQVAKPAGDCGANVNLNSDEVQFSADLISFLDSVLKRAASDAGVIYVDTEYALVGHRLCEAPASSTAMNGFTVGQEGGVGSVHFIGQESYHPNALGHRLMADAILAKTTNLTQPMPLAKTNYGRPYINPNDTLLQNAPAVGYTPKTLIWAPTNEAVQFVMKNKSYIFHPMDAGLSLGSPFSFVVHSDPITLATGIATDKEVRITITSTLPTGFHTLDLYGTDESGREVDIRQVVFVASEGDLKKPCLGLPTSGQDADEDGVDDTCDADPSNPAIPGISQGSEGGDSSSLLRSAPITAPDASSTDASEQPQIDNGVIGSAASTTTTNNPSAAKATEHVASETETTSVQDNSGVLGTETIKPNTTKELLHSVANLSENRDSRHWLIYIATFMGVVLMVAFVLKLARR